jgi:hypothetical protein
MDRTPRDVTRCDGEPLFRVWIADFAHGEPRAWHDVPAHLTAREPAEERCFTALEAAQYVEAFNRVVLARRRRHWAIPVPVRIRIEGDLSVGQRIESREIDFTSLVRVAEIAARRNDGRDQP